MTSPIDPPYHAAGDAWRSIAGQLSAPHTQRERGWTLAEFYADPPGFGCPA